MTVPPRPPAVAGQFYPSDAQALARAVEAAFASPRGPGTLPTRHRTGPRRLRAVIVPHAGLRFSGPIAALAFARVAAEPPPADVLVLGVDHHGRARAPSLSRRPWSTPLGPVPPDGPLLDALDRPPLVVDEAAHVDEHSIEVELPFLQYVLPSPAFAALMVPFGPLEELVAVGRAVGRAVAGRDVLLVASSDFSHYVPPATARRQDRRAIDAILRQDAEGLYRTVVDEGISMCGVAPVTALLAAVAGAPLGATLLGWGHSGDAEPMEEVVGYAAIALAAPEPPSAG